MMNKQKFSNWEKVKSLMIFPVVTLLMFFFGFREVSGMQITEKIMTAFEQDTTKAAQAQDEIYTKVDKEPVYPGGDTARAKFFGENIKYPLDETEKGIKGTVYVKFVVEKDGSISDAQVLRSVSKELDDEALRVIKLMPKWTPGMLKGEVVRTSFIMPIKFELDKDYPKTEADSDFE